jgi:hypothetical protein
MHRARVAVRVWFWAAYLVTAHSPGFSARQLQRQLGLGRYETAWVMLQKLRRAMIRPDRDRSAGIGEVDETYLGGAEEGRAGCRWRDSRKSIVVAAVEVRGRGTGRIRLGTVPDVSGPVFTHLKTWVWSTHRGVSRKHRPTMPCMMLSQPDK